MNRLYSIKLSEFFFVALILSLLVILFHETFLDQTLIHPFFSKTEPHWPWRDHFFTETLLHKGGVKFVALLALITIGLRFHPKVRNNPNYKIFIYHTFLSVAFSIALVAFIKKSNPILCPWSLKVFGGPRDFVSLSDFFNSHLRVAKCFPGGHSSGAYAWISLYFSYQLTTGRRKYLLLLPGLILGFIFGITQQMRGAHFASHDFGTILVCWIVAGMMTYPFYYFKKSKN